MAVDCLDPIEISPPPERGRDRPPARPWLRAFSLDRLAAGLLLLGVILRFYRLDGRSLWLDEVRTARSAQFGSLAEVLDWTRSRPDQMPLVDILAWLTPDIGQVEWMLRLPAAVFSSLEIPALYLLGRQLGRQRAGLIAALLATVSPFSVWYGQEARAYAPLMLLTTLQMLFAYRALRYRRSGDWLCLTVTSILNLYTHYLAIAATAAAFFFIGVTLLVSLAHRAGVVRGALPQVGAAVLAVAVTSAAYLPWLPYLDGFLKNGNVGFGRHGAGHIPTLAELLTLLQVFDLSGILVALLGVGAVVVILDARAGRWRESALIVIWLAVPLTGLWIKMGGSIVQLVPRYFSFLVPAALLVVALAIDGIAWLGRHGVQRWAVDRRRSGLPTLISIALLFGALLVVLAQWVPVLAASYGRQKDDYRGVADHIAASSPADSVILALGQCAAYTVESLGYYLALRQSPIRVIHASRLDARAVELLRQSTGDVWAVAGPCNGLRWETRARRTGLEVTRFAGLVAIPPQPQSARSSPLEQAEALLAWAKPLQADVQTSLALVSALRGSTKLGDDILSASSQPGSEQTPSRWVFPAGTAPGPDQRSFVLTPNGPMVNVTYVLSPEELSPGQVYILSFRCQSTGLQGEQRVFASAQFPDSSQFTVFPDGAGYPCASTEGWSDGTFALLPPAGFSTLMVWLRATGTGVAEYRDVELRQVRPDDPGS